MSLARWIYKVTAEDSKYTQRNTIDVGDEFGHQLVLFEIHRTFPSNAPVINGVKLKETWTRGYADWDAFRKTVVRPKHGPLRHLGEDAAVTRKRRKANPTD